MEIEYKEDNKRNQHSTIPPVFTRRVVRESKEKARGSSSPGMLAIGCARGGGRETKRKSKREGWEGGGFVYPRLSLLL